MGTRRACMHACSFIAQPKSLNLSSSELQHAYILVLTITQSDLSGTQSSITDKVSTYIALAPSCTVAIAFVAASNAIRRNSNADMITLLLLLLPLLLLLLLHLMQL